MKYILESKKLNKNYDIAKHNHQILRDINLKIEEGEFISIMGPSGSGKSTLLYNMSGMDRCTSGSVLFNNHELSTLPEKALSSIRLTKMGFIFPQMLLLKNLSIFDNIVLSGYLAKQRSKTEVNQRACELMEKMGIAHLKKNSVTQVSGGQLQRAAICRALINEPDILFGDEPTGALNSSSASAIMDLFSDINQRETTILIVTHDIRVAVKTDRIVYILDGEIRKEKHLGRYMNNPEALHFRERELSNWLNEMEF